MKIVSFEYKGTIYTGEIRNNYIHVFGEGYASRYIGYSYEPKGFSIRLKDVRVKPPIETFIIAVIVNSAPMLGYSNTLEARRDLRHPRYFVKTPNTLIGDGENIYAYKGSRLRPEVEVAIVIGKRIKDISSRKDARDSIFGLAIFNDITSSSDTKEDSYYAYRRDPESGEIKKQFIRGPLFIRKNRDTFGPLGPYITTLDEISDPNDLYMESRFNNNTIQKGSTSDLIFDIYEIIMHLSSIMTLVPGYVISTGTIGYIDLNATDHTEFSLPEINGTLTTYIKGLGVLTNKIIYI